jgi:HAD superfamily phosphoserine phosphatase-like hydrolase
MPNKKLICLDVDGTLTNIKSSWLVVTETLGCSVDEVLSYYGGAMAGKIPFAEGEERVAEIFRSSGKATKEFIGKIFEKEPLKPEAVELVEYLKRDGYDIWLVSGSVDIHVQAVAKQIGAVGFYAHASLEFDQQGILSKINYGGDQCPWKAGVVRELAAKYNIPVKEIIFVGDGENDIDVFKETGRGIAVFPYDERLEGIAWKKVKSLSEIKDILQ